MHLTFCEKDRPNVKCSHYKKKKKKKKKKKNLHVPFEPATSLQGLHPTDILVHVHKNVCLTIFTPALSVIAKDWQQSKCPSVGWELAKSVWVHSHNGMLGSC